MLFQLPMFASRQHRCRWCARSFLGFSPEAWRRGLLPVISDELYAQSVGYCCKDCLDEHHSFEERFGAHGPGEDKS